MTRIGHQMLGAACGLGAAEALGFDPFTAVCMAVVAAVVAPLPDVDQRRWWRDLFGEVKALRHRRLTHWWGLPAMLLPLFFVTNSGASRVLGAILIGWFSHLAGDWVFGKRGPAITGWRGPGIPLAPWWGYHGLGLKCGGAAEKYGAWPALGLVLALQAAVLTGIA